MKLAAADGVLSFCRSRRRCQHRCGGSVGWLNQEVDDFISPGLSANISSGAVRLIGSKLRNGGAVSVAPSRSLTLITVTFSYSNPRER